MPKLKYMSALDAAWDELKVWVKDGRFVPENEESIQCFLYHGMVSQLGTAKGVRSKPTTDKPLKIFDQKKKLDVKDMHFPDFILGDPKEVVIEIKFARGDASILSSCKRDVEKLKTRHSAPGVSKVFILFDVNPDHAFFNETQRAALQAVDLECRLMHYPDTLSTNPQKEIAQRAADKAKANALQLNKKRSDAAKKAHETIKIRKAAVVAAAK